MAAVDPGTTFTDFRFEETNINLNIEETYNNHIEYPYNSSSWQRVAYGDSYLVSNVTSSNSSIATARKIDTTDLYILITAVSSGTCTISADCKLSDGTTKTITCQVTVTSASNSTGKYLLDSNGNRFSPIVSAETVYLEDGTSVKETLSGLEELLSEV